MEGLGSTTLSSASSYLRVVSIHVNHRTTDHLANVSAIARGSVKKMATSIYFTMSPRIWTAQTLLLVLA